MKKFAVFSFLCILLMFGVAFAENQPAFKITEKSCRIETFLYRLISKADHYGVVIDSDPFSTSFEGNNFVISDSLILVEYRSDGHLSVVFVMEKASSGFPASSLILACLNEEVDNKEDKNEQIKEILDYLISRETISLGNCDLSMRFSEGSFSFSALFKYE